MNGKPISSTHLYASYDANLPKMAPKADALMRFEGKAIFVANLRLSGAVKNGLVFIPCLLRLCLLLPIHLSFGRG